MATTAQLGTDRASPPTSTLTPDQARDRIQAQGLTISVWAEQHHLKTSVVYDVLLGRNKGRFGGHGFDSFSSGLAGFLRWLRASTRGAFHHPLTAVVAGSIVVQ